MKYLITLTTAVAAIVASVSAAPLVAKDTTSTAAISRQFRLKTQVLAGNMDFNNQYLETYHTGAGANAPTFSKTGGSIGYINNTVATFIYGEYTVQLALGPPEDLEATWAPLSLNIYNSGLATKGFSIGPNGYFTHTKVTDGTTPDPPTTQGFDGWRVCNWVHEVPELFYNYYEPNPELPTSCASVLLVPEYVN